jgi:Homeodomain-like domain
VESFHTFNLICERFVRHKKRPMTESEHNNILVNYIRFKVGLPPIIQRGVGLVVKQKSKGGPRRIDHDRVLFLRSQGWEWEDIAVEVGCSRCVVGRIIRRNANGISR